MGVSTRTDRDAPAVLEPLDGAGDMATVIETARSGVEPTQVSVSGADGQINELRLYGLDGEGGVSLIDTILMDRHRAYPPAKAGKLTVETPEAAVRYAHRHLDADESTLWVEIDAGRVTIVFNDHSDADVAGWADHQVTMQLKRSPEWQAWSQLSGKLVEQSELARFLEEHILEVIDPDGSTLIEVAQTFHATQGVTFKSSQQLHSGEQRLVWEEDLQATAGLGKHVDIPTDLKIRLRPWLGVDPIDVDAKFRFRVASGQLRLAVELLRMEEISRAAVEAAGEDIGQQLELEPIQGVPPQPRR